MADANGLGPSVFCDRRLERPDGRLYMAGAHVIQIVGMGIRRGLSPHRAVHKSTGSSHLVARGFLSPHEPTILSSPGGPASNHCMAVELPSLPAT